MVRKIVDLHPQAIVDGREARDHYLSKSPQAEERFRVEIERAIRLIRERPEAWPNYLHGTRRFVLKSFPYSLVYTTDGSNSLVIAIAHAKRSRVTGRTASDRRSAPRLRATRYVPANEWK